MGATAGYSRVGAKSDTRPWTAAIVALVGALFGQVASFIVAVYVARFWFASCL